MEMTKGEVSKTHQENSIMALPVTKHFYSTYIVRYLGID